MSGVRISTQSAAPPDREGHQGRRLYRVDSGRPGPLPHFPGCKGNPGATVLIKAQLLFPVSPRARGVPTKIEPAAAKYERRTNKQTDAQTVRHPDRRAPAPGLHCALNPGEELGQGRILPRIEGLVGLWPI